MKRRAADVPLDATVCGPACEQIQRYFNEMLEIFESGLVTLAALLVGSYAITLGARDAARLFVGHVIADMISIAIVAGTVYLSFRFASRLIAWLDPLGVASSASSSRPDSRADAVAVVFVMGPADHRCCSAQVGVFGRFPS